jgi:hypothetical protein
MQFKQLILITGVERSGSTLISRVLQLCEANAGQTNKMRENVSLRALTQKYLDSVSNSCFMPDLNILNIPDNWDGLVAEALKNEKIPESMPFMFKYSGIAQMWPVWHLYYPDAKWIIVRRRTGDILNSLMETAYMKRFKDARNIKLVNATNEKEAWLWWVHCYEDLFREMIATKGFNYRIIWPERMRDGDFEQVKEMVSWCGLKWNEEVVDVMKTLLK